MSEELCCVEMQIKPKYINELDSEVDMWEQVLHDMQISKQSLSDNKDIEVEYESKWNPDKKEFIEDRNKIEYIFFDKAKNQWVPALRDGTMYLVYLLEEDAYMDVSVSINMKEMNEIYDMLPNTIKDKIDISDMYLCCYNWYTGTDRPKVI